MPFDIELRFKPLKVDIKGYQREIKRAMIKLWRDAIGEFVNTIVFLDLVPVDTGMAAASLHDAAVAARIWGATKSIILLKRRRTRRKGLTTMSGTYDSNSFREIKAGIAAADKATKISFAYPNMEFNFSINVFQWLYWEVIRNEWDALEPAAEAFIRFINENLEAALPKLENFVR